MRPDLAHHPAMDAYGEQIANLPHVPLRVTLRTLTPVVAIEPLNLDGILALGMVRQTLCGKILANTLDPYWLPLPLHVDRWVDGLPLWSSTTFRRVGGGEGTTHYHKRTEANPYSLPAIAPTLGHKRPRRQPNTAAGQYMNYRIPEPRQVAEHWEATCLGNAEAIAVLMAQIVYVGKGGNRGNGRVDSWHLERIKAFALEDDFGQPMRPLPTETPPGMLCGWTPPYWRRDLWRLCRVP